ncbi:transferase [Streptomyces sp. CBMA152]|uniref:transferase n=1 Tax=Streptomyces sp. CBMA152 TaxID=1896312 RepID=UPI00166086D2|nr:transferase [Streptomyces sp. CBMA152]MBD0746017.1 transferase [Streptomyces sp. CBMA152]
MLSVCLGDYVRSVTQGPQANTPYGDLAGYELAHFLARWPELHTTALAILGDESRVHPTAEIHRTAVIGEDVIIGPHVKVHEFTTVRSGSFLAAGVSVGFNCEVTHAYVGEGTVLGHRIGINRAVVGAGVHLSSSVTVAAINLCEDMMRHPDREVVMRGEHGLYRCGTPRFGALIGDGTQTGHNIALGPGTAIGRASRIDSGVTLTARIVPAHSVISAPHIAETRVRRRRCS